MLGAKSITEIQLKGHLYEFLSNALPAAPIELVGLCFMSP